MKFNAQIRQQMAADMGPLLDKFEQITEQLRKNSSITLIWEPLGKDEHDLYDYYLDVLSVVYLNKYYYLCQGLIEALNTESYLIYGLIGRAIIEHTAILRYYLTSKMLPLVEMALADGKVTSEEVQEIIPWLEKHLTGNRFEWNIFLADYFDELDNIQSGHVLKNSQVNVITCLEKWIKEDPSITHLYELFSDLVHPNLGSTLMISRLVDNQIGIGGNEGKPVGLEIVNRTFGKLVKIFEEVQYQLIQIKEFKFSAVLRVY
jgi:hypothetical protein